MSTKYWWYWQQGRGLWLGGDVLPGLPGLTKWKYCYRGGDKRLAWWRERPEGMGGNLAKVHFRCHDFAFQVLLRDKFDQKMKSDCCFFWVSNVYNGQTLFRMLGIMLQGVAKIISAMFSSSSFHRGLVANIFDSCKSSPLSCFAQSGGFLPSHYPSFLPESD